jgi:hypothetical protein
MSPGCPMVPGMSDHQEDPSANTARFQAFANEAPEPEKRAPIAMIATVAVAAIVIVGLIAFLATR